VPLTYEDIVRRIESTKEACIRRGIPVDKLPALFAGLFDFSSLRPEHQEKVREIIRSLQRHTEPRNP
jgi:hypothetical protein